MPGFPSPGAHATPASTLDASSGSLARITLGFFALSAFAIGAFARPQDERGPTSFRPSDAAAAEHDPCCLSALSPDDLALSTPPADAEEQGGTHGSSSCPAGNVRDNRSSPFENGADFVPVTTDDTLGFYAVYSTRTASSGNSISNNVAIFLIELKDGSLLVFGSGYGNPSGAGTAAKSAAYDAANVDVVVRQCMGNTPGNTPIVFVSPHWHGDHINTEFPRALEDLGYQIDDIWFHEDDQGSILSSYGWTSAEIAKFRTFPDASCHVEVGSFDSTIGKVWVTGRSGHAAGAIDLVIDVRGNPNDRFMILGSVAGGECPAPPAGVRQQITSHGNILLSDDPQTVPYGCGYNAVGSLVVLSGEPALGTNMIFGIDDPLRDVAPGSIPMLFASLVPDPGIPCGSLVHVASMPRTYEVLVDALSGTGFPTPLVGAPWIGPGNPSAISYMVPGDVGFLGLSVYAQGAMFQFGSGGVVEVVMLTEALELRLGI